MAALTLALVAGTAGPAAAAPSKPLRVRLAQALRVPHVAPWRTGALAYDLRTGKEVFAHNKQLALAPASTEKLAVAFAALATLGAEVRLETHVLGAGELVGSTWRGPLVLKGFGDPTLSRADLRRLARGVRAFGIRRVTGGVVGDESFFDARRGGAGWKPSFLIGESPPLSALVVDRGRYAGYVSLNPALVAAASFRAELRRAGIGVAGRTRVARTNAAELPIAYVHSPRLSEIVRFMCVESDNFTAEMLLKQLGATQGEPGTSAAGGFVVRSMLEAAGVPVAGVRVVDGSGLSPLDRLTAASLVALLRASWADPTLRPNILRSLPVAGMTGTLARRLRRGPARGRVLAKTGTTSIASSLAGYVGSRYAFAILQNGRPVSSWWARVAQDRFVTVLAAQ